MSTHCNNSLWDSPPKQLLQAPVAVGMYPNCHCWPHNNNTTHKSITICVIHSPLLLVQACSCFCAEQFHWLTIQVWLQRAAMHPWGDHRQVWLQSKLNAQRHLAVRSGDAGLDASAKPGAKPWRPPGPFNGCERHTGKNLSSDLMSFADTACGAIHSR